MSKFVTESKPARKAIVFGAAMAMLGLSLANTCSVAFAADGDDVDALVENVTKLSRDKQYKKCETLLRDALRTKPDSAKLHMVLGNIVALQAETTRPDQRKQIDELYEVAILEETQALKLDPKLHGALLIRGRIYANQRKHDLAIKDMQEACSIKPTSYGAHRDLGIACLTAGRVDEAIDAFKKAGSIKPEQPEAHMKLAILLSMRGDSKEALKEANEAVKLAPKNAETHIALANIMLESGDAGGSIEPFKTAMSMAKNHPNALSGYGVAIAKKDPAELATGMEYQRKALASSGGFFLPAYVRLADFLYKSGKPVEAEDQYKKALKLNPDDALVGTAYGKFLDAAGRKDDARAALKKVLDKSPDFKPASDALAALGQSGAKTK